jgi:hypothetical protein
MTSRLLCSSFVILAACFDGAHRDSNACAAADTCETPMATCSGNTLRTFQPSCDDGTCSYASTDTDCGSVGCCADHCCAVVPSNRDVFGKLESTGMVLTPLNGTFDTDTQCTEASPLGACTVVARTGLPEACVCRMDELSIGILKIGGTRALALLASRKVTIYGQLDVSADVVRNGPGASSAYPTAAALRAGGEGGSFGSPGGGASPADGYGTDNLIPLHGGMRGRNGGTPGGGGGGGALQITAGERIDVNGVIDAGGGGGTTGTSSNETCGGSGGGSGGAILLEAPIINVPGFVAANGGGGGGGAANFGVGTNAADASSSQQASGGVGSKNNFCDGKPVPAGDGGRGAFDLSGAESGGPLSIGPTCAVSFGGGGGGGGGLGRIRINTSSECNCTGRVLPRPSTGLVAKS